MSINTVPAANIKGRRQGGRKIPKRITADYLHNAGLYYLQRYATGAENFRAVMLRKVRRSCLHHTDQDFEECAAMVDRLVEKFMTAGLLDDASYIAGMVASLRRRGLSAKSIMQKMQAKSIPPDAVRPWLDSHDADRADGSMETDDPDFKAALIFARRKKIGPYAARRDDGDQNNKAFAKFARAGFSYDVARRVLALHDRPET